MAKNTQQKQKLIGDYKEKISSATGIYFFSGSLNAKQTQDIKNRLSVGAKLSLLKNTLFNNAAKDSGIAVTAEGYNNVVFVNDGLIENAVTLSKFASENEFSVNKVIIGKEVYDGTKIKQIATLGSSEQVYGKLVGVISMPTTMVVRALQSPMQKLVRVLSQVQPKN